MASKRKPKTPIIVESPTKTRTLKRFLGDEYDVLATKGHVRDLPEKDFAVDLERGFRPTYEVIPARRRDLAVLAKHVAGADRVYLACDPDREGEAIAWHVAEVLGIEPDRRARIEFNEITERAVRAALAAPRPIDLNLVNAQQARRVLDRIVGYQLSPLLQQRLGGWGAGSRSLSAGRVQSAALRIVVERERERVAFVPQEYWRIRAVLRPVDREENFQAEVVRRDGEKLQLRNQTEADEALAELRQASYVVADVTRREVSERPQPPFRTSTLQRAASARLGFPAAKTMAVAQQLYEGVDLPEGTVGLITYMRTDSTRISAEARAAATKFIEANYGQEYVGPGARGKAAKGSQDAHEAIRPTDVSRTPDALGPYLTPDQQKLYRLIWQRFVASQMAPAVYDQTTVDISAGRYGLRTTARVLRFPGWRAVYGAGEADDEAAEPGAGENGGAGNGSEPAEGIDGPAAPGEQKGKPNGEAVADRLPHLSPGESLVLVDLLASQHFTQPPPRFTQGTLVAELERYGIGRPSTYAPILETLRQRRYVRSVGRYLVPTSLGIAVYDFLMEHFPHVMDLQFTARMEEQLDAVERGESDWVKVLEEFYEQFARWLQEAQTAEPKVIEGQTCPECGGRLVERFSRFGRFAACENYPACKYTRDVGWAIAERCPECGQVLQVVLTRQGRLVVKCTAPECDYLRDSETHGEEAGGEESVQGGVQAAPKCEECGADLVLRRGPKGRRFWGCSRYPDCTYTRSVTRKTVARRTPVGTGLACPECGRELVVRWGRRGPFLGCSGFPQCRFTRNCTPQEKAQYLGGAGASSAGNPGTPEGEGEAHASG